MAPHSSTLAWKVPWTEEPGGLQSMGSWRVGHDWATSLSLSLSCIGEGNGNPLQCSCLENPREGGAWWAAVYRITQSRTGLKWLSSSSSSSSITWEALLTTMCAANNSHSLTWGYFWTHRKYRFVIVHWGITHVSCNSRKLGFYVVKCISLLLCFCVLFIFFQFYWDVIDIQHYVCLRYTAMIWLAYMMKWLSQ